MFNRPAHCHLSSVVGRKGIFALCLLICISGSVILPLPMP
jgi:hypothetical protein